MWRIIPHVGEGSWVGGADGLAIGGAAGSIARGYGAASVSQVPCSPTARRAPCG